VRGPARPRRSVGRRPELIGHGLLRVVDAKLAEASFSAAGPHQYDVSCATWFAATLALVGALAVAAPSANTAARRVRSGRHRLAARGRAVGDRLDPARRGNRCHSTPCLKST
jgi:hypothetical protein